MKFAGDAILAFWNCSLFSNKGMLEQVIKQSLVMQNEFDHFKTPGGMLRMKIGVSIGKVDLHFIGNEESRTFDVTGEAIDDANTAQNNTTSGAVVISKLALMLCDQTKCSSIPVGPEYVQVFAFRCMSLHLQLLLPLINTC